MLYIQIYQIEPQKRVLVVRIGVNFTLTGLEAVVRTAATAHFHLRKFVNNRFSITALLEDVTIMMVAKCVDPERRGNSTLLISLRYITAKATN